MKAPRRPDATILESPVEHLSEGVVDALLREPGAFHRAGHRASRHEERHRGRHGHGGGESHEVRRLEPGGDQREEAARHQVGAEARESLGEHLRRDVHALGGLHRHVLIGQDLRLQHVSLEHARRCPLQQVALVARGERALQEGATREDGSEDQGDGDLVAHAALHERQRDGRREHPLDQGDGREDEAAANRRAGREGAKVGERSLRAQWHAGHPMRAASLRAGFARRGLCGAPRAGRS